MQWKCFLSRLYCLGPILTLCSVWMTFGSQRGSWERDLDQTMQPSYAWRCADTGHLGLSYVYGGSMMLYSHDKTGHSFNRRLLNTYCVRGTGLNLLRPHNRVLINSLLHSHELSMLTWVWDGLNLKSWRWEPILITPAAWEGPPWNKAAGVTDKTGITALCLSCLVKCWAKECI